MRPRSEGVASTGPVRSALYLVRALLAVLVLLIGRVQDPEEALA
jgi:hypothetical protein